MDSTQTLKRADQVMVEMRRHRAAVPVKRPQHPGVTRQEAKLTARELRWLSMGACDDLAATRGIVNGLKCAAVLWIGLLALGLFVLALTGGR